MVPPVVAVVGHERKQRRRLDGEPADVEGIGVRADSADVFAKARCASDQTAATISVSSV
jgi:hypothetical protein